VARVLLPADALVVTASGEPLGYLALALPDAVPMLGLNNNFIQPGDCHALPREAARRLAGHAGPIFLATRGDAAERDWLRATQGLVAAGPCLPVASRLGDASLCPLRRVAAPAPACTTQVEPSSR